MKGDKLSCSGCAHEGIDLNKKQRKVVTWQDGSQTIGVGTGKPSGEMVCATCIRHPEQEKFYKMLKSWYKWWDLRARISVWRTFRPSKCKDMYVLLRPKCFGCHLDATPTVRRCLELGCITPTGECRFYNYSEDGCIKASLENRRRNEV